MRPDVDLIVAGAGIVGVSSALWAQMRGLKVMLCDPEPPGSGASFGNAGTIATYACIPVNDPSIPLHLPRLLASSDSPLSLDLAYVLRNPRWSLSFLANCRPARVAAITKALGAILAHADAGLNPLIAEAGAEDLVVANDCLYLWTTKAGFEGARAATAARVAQGVDLDELGPEEIAALEPRLRPRIHAGIRFNGARHIRDPQALVTRMLVRFEALGGTFRQEAVRETRAHAEGVEVTVGGDRITAGHVVIAAGAHARGIRGSGAERLPLGVERGYHLMFPGEAGRISRPVGWAEAGFYATPMDAGLRLAGTVEIAAPGKKPNRERLRYLDRKGREMFGDLPAPSSEWLGRRPTLPDSLPVIGPSPVSNRILFAFGHQHIGLTLGGITGRIAADLAEGRTPNLPIGDFSADRF